jgi:hypothetical protein
MIKSGHKHVEARFVFTYFSRGICLLSVNLSTLSLLFDNLSLDRGLVTLSLTFKNLPPHPDCDPF